jgi:hypothetical protein
MDTSLLGLLAKIKCKMDTRSSCGKGKIWHGLIEKFMQQEAQAVEGAEIDDPAPVARNQTCCLRDYWGAESSKPNPRGLLNFQNFFPNVQGLLWGRGWELWAQVQWMTQFLQLPPNWVWFTVEQGPKAWNYSQHIAGFPYPLWWRTHCSLLSLLSDTWEIPLSYVCLPYLKLYRLGNL